MEWLTGVGIMVAWAAFRLAIPVAVMAAMVYAIRRLDARLHPRMVK